MENKTFLFLLSLNSTNAAIGRLVLAKIKAELDATASPLWIDAHGVGVFISTPHPAWKVWALAMTDTLTKDQALELKDSLIVQVGPDWSANGDHKSAAWLNSRFPKR